MSRPRKRAPIIDLEAILERPVKVTLDGVEMSMQPFEAQFEQCAIAALKGDIRACVRFINWCLQEKLIKAVEPTEDYQDTLYVPDDWDHDDFIAHFRRYGFPPWPGERDGLTPEARFERKLQAQRRRRAMR